MMDSGESDIVENIVRLASASNCRSSTLARLVRVDARFSGLIARDFGTKT